VRLSWPTRPSHPSVPQTHVLNVAHRGASEHTPENTLAAVHLAARLGAHMVEVDVQRTRDGELVLMHDPTLVRTTDARRVYPDRAPWRVADFTYAELRRLDAGSWRFPDHAGEPVPTLAAVVGTARRLGLGLQLELKLPELHPGIVPDLVATLRGVRGGLAATAGRMVVQSFDFAAMKELKALEPGLPLGLLGSPPRSHLPVLAGWADEVNPRHVTVDRAYVDRVHELGMRCLVWTVNHPAAVRRALRMGVDGVISNRPSVVARELASRRRASMTFDPVAGV
jgi:glycerophosphoryl diester phosphodiesterase